MNENEKSAPDTEERIGKLKKEIKEIKTVQVLLLFYNLFLLLGLSFVVFSFI